MAFIVIATRKRVQRNCAIPAQTNTVQIQHYNRQDVINSCLHHKKKKDSFSCLLTPFSGNKQTSLFSKGFLAHTPQHTLTHFTRGKRTHTHTQRNNFQRDKLSLMFVCAAVC